ncbi:hypothetical protein DFH05DRAFT_888428 [Lentinula detonsa]|uniref:Uncharacterized protein n=1 Tax=Lentinula detonsa TaxID=2804962 RepID=A0A9W8U129_9AGAR|nr:hypothetical protein DFH05DRAFT_888428 [Lentinula detonsa]
MQTPIRERVGGYSDFFSSGFRAISLNDSPSRPRKSSLYSLSSIPSDLIHSIPSTSRRRSIVDDNRRRKPMSWSLKRREESHTNLSTSEKRKKRSSFIEFSAGLFEKMNPGVLQPRSFVEFDNNQKRLRLHSRNGSSGREKLGMSGLIGTHVSSIQTCYPDANERDPFNPSPHSESFFIDLSDSSSFSSSPKRSRHQSFISFSGASVSTLNRFTRRERPASIHSLPTSDLLSSRPIQTKHPFSRSPSYQHPANLDKADSILQEKASSDPESPYEHGNRDLADIDWREFHIQLYDNI